MRSSRRGTGGSTFSERCDERRWAAIVWDGAWYWRIGRAGGSGNPQPQLSNSRLASRPGPMRRGNCARAPEPPLAVEEPQPEFTVRPTPAQSLLPLLRRSCSQDQCPAHAIQLRAVSVGLLIGVLLCFVK